MLFSVAASVVLPENINIPLADTPLEYPQSFVVGGEKNLQGGKGKGIRGEKGGGGKLKEKKGRNGKGKKKKTMERGRIEPPSRIDLAPMPYPSPTVTLKLHCEQFWTFIVKVTFDLLRTLLRMHAYEQTDKDNYI